MNSVESKKKPNFITISERNFNLHIKGIMKTKGYSTISKSIENHTKNSKMLFILVKITVRLIITRKFAKDNSYILNFTTSDDIIES